MRLLPSPMKAFPRYGLLQHYPLTCTGCDYSPPEERRLNLFVVYRLDHGLNIAPEMDLGWCHVCNGCSNIEYITDVEQLLKEFEKSDQSRQKADASPIRHASPFVSRPRGFFSRLRHLSRLSELSLESQGLSFEQQSWQADREWLNQMFVLAIRRGASARCITCWSKHVQRLHFVDGLVQNFTHNCGGRLKPGAFEKDFRGEPEKFLDFFVFAPEGTLVERRVIDPATDRIPFATASRPVGFDHEGCFGRWWV